MRAHGKKIVFVLYLLPLFWVVALVLTGHAGANPVEYATRFLGDWALRFLLLALAITPVRRLTGFAKIAAYRRMAGLFAFFYVSLHLMMYVGVDLFFRFDLLWADIVKRKFITVGMAAFVLLIPLAVTSTNGMVKRLGGKNWRNLHKLVYIVGPLAVLHYFWMVKADVFQPTIYAVILAILLLLRLPFAQKWRLPLFKKKPR